jgi:hypothetical protein
MYIFVLCAIVHKSDKCELSGSHGSKHVDIVLLCCKPCDLVG